MKNDRAEREEQFRAAAAGLSTDTVDALHQICFEWGDYYYPEVELVGAAARIEAGSGSAYRRTLTLCNVSGLPERDCGFWDLSDSTLSCDGTDYVLTGAYLQEENEDLTPFAVHFSNAVVEVRRYRVGLGAHAGTPWDVLEYAVHGLLGAQAGAAPLNEQEKALLPLAEELGRFLGPYAVAEPFDGEYFPRLRTLMEQYGYHKPLSLLEKLEKLEGVKEPEKNDAYWNKLRRTQLRLIALLNRKDFEPLWREIYRAFTTAQTDYPTYAEGETPLEPLKRTRSEVEKLLHARGYTGSYPDFYKTGAIRGLRHSGPTQYGMDYVIGAEKYAVYHIHCIEENASRLHLIFGCGMELLRKGEQKGDIYSCMFNADGRCFYKTASEPRDWSGKYTQEKLCRIVDAAVKRAELRNLNKEEQKLVSAAPQAETKNLFWLLIPISGLFAAGSLVLFVSMFGLLLGLLEGDIQAMFTELAKMPWLRIFMGLWLAFFAFFYLFIGLLISFAKKK